MKSISIQLFHYSIIGMLTLIVVAPVLGQRNGSWATRNSNQMKEVLQPLVEDKMPSICEIKEGNTKLALGTVVSADGLIVTKLSEVHEVEGLKCVFESGKEYDGKIVSRSEESDLALIQINAAQI